MPRLKREVGLIGILSAGIGVILGAGIYALIGKAAIFSGNMLWLSFLIASIVAMFTGLSYAELSSKFPKAGGEFVYVSRIINKKLANLVGFALILVGVFSCATLCIAFGGYLKSMLNTPIILFGILLILFIALINYIGIKFSIKFNIIATIIEVAGLIIIIVLGIKYFGTVNYIETPETGIIGIFTAIGIIFFAYLGFEDIVNLAEETKHARKLMPIAVVASLIITTLLYILVSLSAVSIIGFQELGLSDSPLTLIFQTATGLRFGGLFSIIALFSIFNTVLLLFIAATRIAYSMGINKSLPLIFGKLDERTRTPYFSIIILAILTILVIIMGNISLAAQLTNIVILAVFVVINIAVIKLRYSGLNVRGFNVPLNIGRFPLLPLFGAVSSFIILIITFLNVINVI